MDSIDRLPQTGERGHALKQHLICKPAEHSRYSFANGQDMPEIRDWMCGE